MKPRLPLHAWLMASAALINALPAFGGGLPEPDLVIYGAIRNVSGGQNIRLTAGTLNWTFSPLSGQPGATASVTISNVNDQFSYVLRLSCASAIAGFPVSPNTLTLGTSFDRATVTVDGVAATFVNAGQQTLVLSATDRGRIERVDLQISMGGGDVLPSNWQMQYFGRTGIDPNDDPDGDGMDNLSEYRAGTNPVDPNSLFEVQIAESAAGGPRLTWPGVAGVRYAVQRSRTIETGFEDLAANIAATPPTNVFQDTTGAGAPYFYRLIATRIP